jgi:hypothetical protein
VATLLIPVTLRSAAAGLPLHVAPPARPVAVDVFVAVAAAPAALVTGPAPAALAVAPAEPFSPAAARLLALVAHATALRLVVAEPRPHLVTRALEEATILATPAAPVLALGIAVVAFVAIATVSALRVAVTFVLVPISHDDLHPQRVERSPSNGRAAECPRRSRLVTRGPNP